MSANAFVIVFLEEPEGGRGLGVGGVPVFQLTALLMQLVALSLSAHDKALFPESHVRPPPTPFFVNQI